MAQVEIYRPREEEEETESFFHKDVPTYNGLLSAKSVRRIDYSSARKKPQILAALAANVGSLLFGCAMGWSSPVQPQITNNDPSDADIFGPWFINLSDNEMAWVASLLNVGALIGAVVAGPLMDYLGRRGILMCVTFPSSIGWVLIALAQNKNMFYFGRLCVGVGGGISSVVAPSYITEITTPKMRGPLGMLYYASLCCGLLISSVLGWLPWRWMCFLFTSTSFTIFGVLYMVPESPYYILWKGLPEEEAEKALQWLRGPFYNIQPELEAISNRVRVDLAHAPRFDHIFLPWIYRPLSISVALMFLQQLCGISVILFYSVEIFRLSGSNINPLASGLILSIVLLGMVFVAAYAVERIGRRRLFLASEGLTCLCLFVLGAYFYVLDTDPAGAESIGWLPLVSLILFIAAYSLGLGPLPWLITSEIVPSKFRGPGTSIAAFFNWTTVFLVTKLFVNMQASMGNAGTFWLFGSFCFVGFLFGLYILPETKGRTSEQIQTLFEK